MAKGVPADIADAQPFRHRFDEHPHDRHRPVEWINLPAHRRPHHKIEEHVECGGR
jgi:hypothetical protein